MALSCHLLLLRSQLHTSDFLLACIAHYCTRNGISLISKPSRQDTHTHIHTHNAFPYFNRLPCSVSVTVGCADSFEKKKKPDGWMIHEQRAQQLFFLSCQDESKIQCEKKSFANSANLLSITKLTRYNNIMVIMKTLQKVNLNYVEIHTY